MNIFSLLSFAACSVYLYLGIYIFRYYIHEKNSPPDLKRTNIVFSLMVLSFAVWSFGYGMLYSCDNKSSCEFWHKIASIGFCVYPSFIIHFFLSLSRYKGVLKKWWIYPLIYSPPFYFLFLIITGGFFARDFIRLPLFWMEKIDTGSFPFYVFALYFSTCTWLGLLLYGLSIESGTVKLRKQVQYNCPCSCM